MAAAGPNGETEDGLRLRALSSLSLKGCAGLSQSTSEVGSCWTPPHPGGRMSITPQDVNLAVLCTSGFGIISGATRISASSGGKTPPGGGCFHDGFAVRDGRRRLRGHVMVLILESRPHEMFREPDFANLAKIRFLHFRRGRKSALLWVISDPGFVRFGGTRGRFDGVSLDSFWEFCPAFPPPERGKFARIGAARRGRSSGAVAADSS